MPATVLVVFGSESDSPVFDKLMLALKEKNVEAELQICSAHKNPKELEKIISSSKAKVIIAGAGLSAALPGVIASQTLKPVIGLPVEGNYSGLDALLSVHQMPSGIPVLGTGVNAVETAACAAGIAVNGFEKITITKNFEEAVFGQKFSKMLEILQSFGAAFETVESLDSLKNRELGINFVELSSEHGIDSKDFFAINVPLLEKSTSFDAQKLLEKTRTGIWVGLNRLENSALAAVGLLNVSDNSFSKKLLEYRKNLAVKKTK
ncbi:MAG TPA: AIR carboxylase family protein [archaeon]|nr:AIR carboxylase family protein [archaeon]